MLLEQVSPASAKRVYCEIDLSLNKKKKKKEDKKPSIVFLIIPN